MSINKLAQISIEELAVLISDRINNSGVKVTLSGGACAQIYSNSEYVTADLDFVENYSWHDNQEKIEKIMLELGFEKKGRIFINSSVQYSVEFPPGPLEIGEESPITPVKMVINNKKLLLLSPTDSVKDRLTGYFYGNDLQCLEQALMICKMNTVDRKNIQKWLKKESPIERVNEFLKQLNEISE